MFLLLYYLAVYVEDRSKPEHTQSPVEPALLWPRALGRGIQTRCHFVSQLALLPARHWQVVSATSCSSVLFSSGGSWLEWDRIEGI